MTKINMRAVTPEEAFRILAVPISGHIQANETEWDLDGYATNVTSMGRVWLTLKGGTTGQKAAILGALFLSIITGLGVGFIIHAIQMSRQVVQMRRDPDNNYTVQQPATDPDNAVENVDDSVRLFIPNHHQIK